MTAPDSRDSVERVVAEMRDAAGATSDHYEAQSLRKFARRLQALARGPQQAGGEDYSALKTRLRDSAMLSTLPEWCRKELEQGADAIAALQAEVARLRRERAELIDKLNGTPCAEVRWQQERERLQAALLEAGRDAFRKGWVNAAKWAQRDDLLADIGSPAYVTEQEAALNGGQDDA